MSSFRKPLSSRNIQPTANGARKPSNTKKSRLKSYDKALLVSVYATVTAQSSSAISICENDLTNPTPERVQQMYLSILDSLFEQITVDSFKQTAFLSRALDHPEMLDDVTFRLQFVRLMKRLMKACLVDDFGIEDIINPDSKRTCRNLSSLINYMQFGWNVYNAEDTFDVLNDETERLKEDYITLQRENKESRHKIRALEKQKTEEQELEQELKHAIVAQQQDTHTLQVQYEAAMKRHQAVTEVFTKSEQKLELLKNELGKWTQRIDDLRSKVVTSPDKLKANLVQLEKQNQDAKLVKDEAESLLIMWESLVSKAHRVSPVISGLNEDLTMVKTKVVKGSELQSTFTDVEEQIKRQKLVLREATAKVQNLLRHVKVIENESNCGQYEGHMPHFHATDGLLRDVHLIKQELKEREKTDVEVVKETNKIRDEIVAVQDQYDMACSEIAQATSKLTTAIQSQMDQYVSLIKPITEGREAADKQ